MLVGGVKAATILLIFSNSMTIEEAEKKLLQVLKQIMEEKLTSTFTNVEVSVGSWFLLIVLALFIFGVLFR